MGRRSLRRRRRAVGAGALGYGALALLLVFLCLQGHRAAAQDLLGHAAVYDLSLSSDRRNARVASVSGRYRYEITDRCDGWAIKHEAQMTVGYLNGETATFGGRLGSWEAKDGSLYRFILRQLTGDGGVEEIDGVATLAEPERPGEVTFAGDLDAAMTLPAGTVFPGRQSVQILQAARGGDLPARWTLFDGWDRTVVGVSGFLVARYAAGRPPRFSSPLLDRQASWRIQIGYYDLDEEAAEPELEQEIRVYENGIIGEFVFHYGDFSVDGRLVALEGRPEPGC